MTVGPVGPVGPVGQEKEAKRQTLLEIVECPTKSLEQIHLELADHLGGFFRASGLARRIRKILEVL